VTLSIHRIAIRDNPALDDFAISATTSSVDGSESFGPAGSSGPIIPAGSDSQNPCVVQTGTASLTGCLPTVGVFRRPLVTTNTFFDSSVLWDGRQNLCVGATPPPGGCPAANQPIRNPLLEAQVSGAAQTLPLSAPPCNPATNATTGVVAPDPCAQAAHFMTGIFTAMTNVRGTGTVTDSGAGGGPQFLANLSKGAVGSVLPPCTPLVEATASAVSGGGAGNPPPNCAAPTGAASPPNGRGFNIFIPFLPTNLQAGANTPSGIQAIFAFCASSARSTAGNQGQLAIACGENIFDNRPINDPAVPRDLSAVSGSFGSVAPPGARCTSCHSAQNVGDNPNPAFIIAYTPGGGIGQDPALFVGGRTLAATDAFCAAHPTDPFCSSQTFNLPDFQQRTSKLPLYTLTCNPGAITCTPGASVQLTDPGLALISHAFRNAGAQKPPVLRNLAARAPFFHNGAAQDLDDLVDFYNQNFSIGLTSQEHRDLVAFMQAL